MLFISRGVSPGFCFFVFFKTEVDNCEGEKEFLQVFFSPTNKSSETEETWSEGEYTLAVSSLLPTLPRPLSLHRPFVLRS